ncbi:hypothetical protein [Vibrio phage PJN101]|nr:hypothetical protein [Vibrio phage PJN101]
MSEAKYLKNQIENIRLIIKKQPQMIEDEGDVGNFTCIPMIYAINMGANPDEMGSHTLGCNGECINCLLAVDNTRLNDTENLLKTWELIDE